MAARAPGRVRERFVAWLWQRQRLRGPLVCTDGRIVQVVYPGRAWGEGQPDFQGALIAWPDGRFQRGDVEIHRAPGDWVQHGHQRDPAYRNVMLHVTLLADNARPTLNVLGQTVPTLALEPHLAEPLERLLLEYECDQALTSASCQSDPAAVASMLERAGLQRFGQRADQLEGDLSALSPSELLWRGVARALGYTRNADAMAWLAERVSLGELRSLLAARADEPEMLALGALLGSAGLLPSQRGVQPRGLFAQDAERAWGIARAMGWRAARRTPPFETRRVRPGNHPVRRLAALALLAERFDRSDPVTELARMLLDDPRPARALIRYFEIPGPTREWWTLLDLERGLLPPQTGLVGRDRASEIVINAVLPLLHALGRFWDHRTLAETSLEVYRTFPRVAPNRLVQGMAAQIAGLDGLALADTACRQQGLLHIFRTTCQIHQCERCPAFERTSHRSQAREQGMSWMSEPVTVR